MVGSSLSVRAGIWKLGKVPRTSVGRGAFPHAFLPQVTTECRHNRNGTCGQAQAAPGVPLVPAKGGAPQTGWQTLPRETGGYTWAVEGLQARHMGVGTTVARGSLGAADDGAWGRGNSERTGVDPVLWRFGCLGNQSAELCEVFGL